MLIYAAGPGAELLLLGVLLQVFGWELVFSGSGDLGQVALQSLAIAILLGAGFNLIPFSTSGGVSDGLGIISSPFMSDESIELRLLSFELREMQAMLDAGKVEQAVVSIREYLQRFPSNLALQQTLVSALSAAGDTEQARELVRNKLASADLSKTQRQSWLYQQARVELHAEHPSWLVLDLALQKALAISPRDSGLLATKGAALVMRGQASDGGNVLADVWRSNDGSVPDAELLAYLTIAAHKIGNADAAGQFADAFKQANRSSALAQRVRQLTQAAS
jgi:predicted Zn-dependent protease